MPLPEIFWRRARSFPQTPPALDPKTGSETAPANKPRTKVLATPKRSALPTVARMSVHYIMC